VKFHLIRHGEIEASDLPDLGHNDPSLSDTGRRQAAALAHELDLISKRGPAIDAVYTSPMRPAAETAAVIAETLGTGEPLVSEALGTLTPEVLPPNGGLDAIAAIQDRAWTTLETLREQHDERAVVVLVSHELTIRAVVCRALGMPLTDLKRYELDPASLSTIEFRRAPNGDLRTILAALNESCHLDAVKA
jgi:ribonuclease H / adenosylcobalamin/alpha-ribazole phosphatase